MHEPAISVVDLSSGGQSIKVTFFTGLHYIAPNDKFPSPADKVRYGALLKFGGYVQISLDQLNNDFIGVADLDGVVDKIEIPHYADMSTMGSTTSPAFSIEFWIRPRRMPADQTPMALFLKSSQASGVYQFKLKLRWLSPVFCDSKKWHSIDLYNRYNGPHSQGWSFVI